MKVSIEHRQSIANSGYDKLRDAIADELFGLENAGQPVYALADTHALERIRDRSGLSGEPIPAVSSLVLETLAIDQLGVTPFRWQADAAIGHRRHAVRTPPALPLLLVLSIAAEQMHAGGGVASHNYYSRLHELLNVPPGRRERLEQDYRRHAEKLWGSLNAWLESWEGERGVPTAYAIGGHAYIGLPLSQAVVRVQDRTDLHEIFALEGMAPGLRYAPSDMQSTIEPYIARVPSPLSSNIRRLWQVPAARERILDAACLELATWDGSGQAEATTAKQPVTTRLVAYLRTFPRRLVEFNLMLPFKWDGPTKARFTAASGEVVVPTIAGTGGLTRLSSVEAIRADSLIEDDLKGHLGADQTRPFQRRAKRVVPLRWDDLQGAYVEIERITLGEDSLVLARCDVRNRVETHLTTHARPGWRRTDGVGGLPGGWDLYTDVQAISASDNPPPDLIPLTPRTRTSLTLRGGFVLPGHLRKWSSLDPPEVVALAAGAASICVRINEGSAVDSASVIIDQELGGELTVVPLKSTEIADGEYTVAMYVDGNRRPSSTAILRLRSADSPQFKVDDDDIRLVYSPDSGPTWPLSAGPAMWPAYVNGARYSGEIERQAQFLTVMHEYSPRPRPSTTGTSSAIRIGQPPSADSCLVTGRHRFELPPAVPGHRVTRTIEGECTYCGMVKRFAGTPWAALRRVKRPTQDRSAVVVPPVDHHYGEPDYQVAFDALNHVGHGTYQSFEKIAAQVEGSGLFADSFLRRQEVVGHIDVARDPWLQVTDWAINSATLVPVASNRWVLIGSRSRKMLSQLRRVLQGITVNEFVDAELVLVEVACDTERMSSKENALAEIGVILLGCSPALNIALALPKLSELASALRRMRIPAFRTVESWDTTTATWQPADSMERIGAYRIRDFRSIYIVREAKDIAAGEVAIGNAQLVKHIANMWAGDPLAGYHTLSGSVIVPLGADIPGLYGRALSICSGRAPREIVKYNMVQYQSVAREVADAIFARLCQ